MFLQMNTETYEVRKFMLISRCATRCVSVDREEGKEGGLGGSHTGPKSGRTICALILK